jgi:small subunit ribosomal protein S4
MGEPKFSRRKYARPINPWEAERIKEENEKLKKYGLKNKKELWRAESMLRGFRRQSKDLQARLRYGDVQARKETAQLISRLTALSLLPENATLDDVLALNVEALLSRRLQTLVYLKGYAGTPGQARQLIIHGHAVVSGRKVTIPGYLVKGSEETTIGYNPKSPIANDLHPARPKKEGAPAPVVQAAPAQAAPAPAAAPAAAAPIPALAPAPASAKPENGKPAEKPAANGKNGKKGE